MADIIEQLKLKRKTIEQLQKDKANQEGQEEQLSKQLKEESETDSVEEAEKVVECLCEEKVEHEKLLEDLDKEMDTIILNAQAGSNPGTDE